MTMKRMKEATATAAVSGVDVPPGPTPEERLEAAVRRARAVTVHGRGTRGKSFLCSWLVQRAREAGNNVVACDCDRSNMTLRQAVPGVITPESGDEADVEATVVGLIERAAQTREDIVLDMGAGDVVLQRMARDQQFVSWLPTIGIDWTAIHVMGPENDDCTSLASAEKDGVMAPARTVLVFNEVANTTTMSPAAAFAATVERHPIVLATLERGARLVVMPRLRSFGTIQERGLSLADAAANRAPSGVAPLGLWWSHHTLLWLRQMEVEVDAVKGWLP